MGVEHRWNDSDSKIEVLQENSLTAALFHHRSYT